MEKKVQKVRKPNHTFVPAVDGGLAEDLGGCDGDEASVVAAAEEVEVVEPLEVGVDPLE